MNDLLNLFGLGRIKFGASLASLFALAIFLPINYLFVSHAINILLFLCLLLLTLVSVPRNKKRLSKDPKEVVIDEFLGMYVLILIANLSNLLLLFSSFILFRVLDIFKIWPISALDSIEGEYSFLLDDIALGAIIGILFLLFQIFI